MTLPMTIRVASSTAKIGFVFSHRGVVMEAASSFFLPRLIGHSSSLYLTTTGSILPASSPHFGTLSHHLLPSPDLVLPKALEIAEQIVKQTSTVSTYLIREMMWRNPGSAEGTHLLDSQIMWELYDKGDKKEGIRAFLEKRDPRMEGTVRDGMPANVPWWEPIDTVPRGGKERTAKSRL
jgi:enoyl-CoA hydratase/carnithine racemase